MKRIVLLGSSLFATLLLTNCAGQQNCPPSNMMPPMPPPPPPCCCNNGMGPEGMVSPPPVHGDNTQPPIGNPAGMPPEKGMAHPPHTGMGGIFDPRLAAEACEGKKESDSCTFKDRGWTLTGVCASLPPRHGGPAGPHHIDREMQPPDEKEKKEAPLVCSPEPSNDVSPKHGPRPKNK